MTVWKLAERGNEDIVREMLNADISRSALQLSPADRLELARHLVESVAAPIPLVPAVKEGIRRIEEMAAGRVTGLTEEQYRAAMA